MYGFEKRQRETRLHARRVDDETWLVGQILEARGTEEVLPIRVRNAVGDRAGEENSAKDGALVNRVRGEVADRLDELPAEVRRQPGVVERQLRPVQT